MATKKISDLAFLTEDFETDEDIDLSVTDKILRITVQSSSIVINTQAPNRQIWYSSTISGPQRFDYDEGEWKNKLGKTIDEILHSDLSSINS